jgi:hypothetical protein
MGAKIWLLQAYCSEGVVISAEAAIRKSSCNYGPAARWNVRHVESKAAGWTLVVNYEKQLNASPRN